MQLRLYLIFSFAGLSLLSLAPAATAATSDVSLMAMEEPVSVLAAPNGVSKMTYAYSNGTFVATMVTPTPLLCADTSAPSPAGAPIQPLYYSPNSLQSATPRPFVFGASGSSPDVSSQATGAMNVVYSTGKMSFLGDGLGALVCYGLDANGVRRVTRDIFFDDLEGNPYNSSVTLSVFHLPSSTSDYYGYKIDVTLPSLPVSDNFALVEGYDSFYFNTAPTQSDAGWCQSFDAQTCAFAPTKGNINFSYFNGLNTSLQAPVSPNGAATYHFIVKRYLRSGVTLPLPATPLAIAALFSPTDLQENKLDDNVSAGTNEIANAAPSIVTTDGAWSTFTSGLGALNENTDSGALTFDITDPDTPETNGTLTAAVTLSVNNVSAPVTPSCVLTQSQPVTRQCTIDIPLNNGSFWNAAVGNEYDGLFNTVATDVTNGSYASGVSANARIVATDPLGKMSDPVTVPVHIHSTANNSPTLSYLSPFAPSSDPNDNQTYETYSCSVGAGTGVGGCGSGRSTIDIVLTPAITSFPAVAAAFDELAYQTTQVVAYKDPHDKFTNVNCTSEQAASVFSADGGPIVQPSQGSATQYDMDFVIPSTPPATAVSALCFLTMVDAGAFPNGESAKTATKPFRIVVNP